MTRLRRSGPAARAASAAALIAALAWSPGFAADTPAKKWSGARFSERFETLDWLVGEWQGYGRFAKRTGYIHKRYQYEIGGMYLVERTLDMFPPPEPTTEFEVHQDFSVISRDGITGVLAARGFFVEGFVTTASVTVSPSGDTVVVESETIAGGPPGMRSRFTYQRTGPDSFTLRFDLGSPGEEYRQVEEATLRRIR